MDMHSGEFNTALMGTVYAKRVAMVFLRTKKIDETGMLEILIGDPLSRFD